MFGLMLLLLFCPVAYGEEPVFAPVQEGDVVPFDGRLFNDAAVAKLIIDKQFEHKKCELRIDYEVGLMQTQEKYKYDILVAKSEADDMRLNDLINIRDEELTFLRKQYEPSKSHWWLAGGFVVGAATSIGIMYAVK
jgi:hypothetical protein